jgi:hypothetical protein
MFLSIFSLYLFNRVLNLKQHIKQLSTMQSHKQIRQLHNSRGHGSLRLRGQKHGENILYKHNQINSIILQEITHNMNNVINIIIPNNTSAKKLPIFMYFVIYNSK